MNCFRCVGRVFLLFLVFCLITSMSLVNNDGNIVVAQPISYSYDFEDTCLLCQVSVGDSEDAWISSNSVNAPFYVDNNLPRTGNRNFYAYTDYNGCPCLDNGYWNYHYASDRMITNWSCWVGCYNGYTTSKQYDLVFLDSDDNALITLVNWRAGDTIYWGWAAHNGSDMIIDTVDVSYQYYYLSFEWIDNETVSYCFNGTTKIGTPKGLYAQPRINRTLFGGRQANQCQFIGNFDDINITTYFGFSYEVGDVTINVFNESNISQAISGWDVYVKNNLGGIIYSSINNNNGFVITLNLIGFGERFFEIYADGYYERYYPVTTVRGSNHTLTAYLPPTGEAYLYYIKVQSNIEQPIYQAYLEIARNFNGTIDDVAGGYTDIFGMYPVYLIGSQQYAINITKSGYDTFRGTFITDPNCYGYDCPIVFILDYSYEEFPSGETEAEQISFTGYINRTTDILYLSYIDFMSETINATVYVYEYNYSTSTNSLHGTYSCANIHSFDTSFSNIDNMSRYTVVLFYNHSTFGSQRRTLVFDIEFETTTTQARGDDLFNLNYGSNPFGWSNSFLWVFCIMIYFEGGQQEAGFYMIVAGIILFLVNYGIGFNTVLTTVAGGGIPILHVIVGLGILWRDNRRYRGVNV